VGSLEPFDLPHDYQIGEYAGVLGIWTGCGFQGIPIF